MVTLLCPFPSMISRLGLVISKGGSCHEKSGFNRLTIYQRNSMGNFGGLHPELIGKNKGSTHVSRQQFSAWGKYRCGFQRTHDGDVSPPKHGDRLDKYFHV